MKNRTTISCVLTLIITVMVVSLPLTGAAPQASVSPRTAVVRYSIYFKSNYTFRHDIDFVWTFRNTDWSKVTLQSSTPRLMGSADMDCQGQLVSKTSFDAFQAFGWRFENAAPSDLLHVDFKVKVEVSSFSPSALSASSVGTVEDLNSYFSASDLAKYLNQSYYWDYSSTEVQAVIQDIRDRISGSTNVYDIVRGALAWFAEHMMYSYPYEFDYPTSRVKASEVLKQTFLGRHFGVCRHFSDVFTAVMRGFGVPCIKESGLILTDVDGKLSAVGRHAWCVAYLPRVGWTRIEVTVPDRSSLDVVGVGLIPYPWYYVPEYAEYTNDKPKSSEGTVYPYVIVGGFIRVEEDGLFALTWERVVMLGALAGILGLSVAYLLMQARIRRLERLLRSGVGVHGAYPRPAYCTVCGAPRPPFGTFCTKCGSKLD
jgi:hypothetical protein